jgi:rhodanese-related sulfurtransferase
MRRRILLAGLLLASPLAAAPPANPQIDYPGFQALTKQVEPMRQRQLLDWASFSALAAQPGVLLLDARSASAYAEGHIDGAVNLPLTDFTADSLAQVIGNRDRIILIYCNNNFSNNRRPVVLKSAALSLNIQTFINLVGYGYGNVRELASVIDFDKPEVRWVRGSQAASTPEMTTSGG